MKLRDLEGREPWAVVSEHSKDTTKARDPIRQKKSRRLAWLRDYSTTMSIDRKQISDLRASSQMAPPLNLAPPHHSAYPT